MTTVSPVIAGLVAEPHETPVPTDAVTVSFSHSTGTAILESSLPNEPYARFSIFTHDPVEVVSIDHGAEIDPLGALAGHVSRFPSIATPDGVVTPFVGGWIGYLSYEAGLTIERIDCTTRRDLPIPALRFALYDSVATFDHTTRRWWLTAIDWPPGIARHRPPPQRRLDSLRRLLDQAGAMDTQDAAPPRSSPLRSNMSYPAYLAKVDRAKEYIEAGDIYQANLTQRFACRTDASPTTLYRRLRRATPSSHAAYLDLGESVVLSSSPELFLDLRGSRVVTRPIKGTRPRVGDCTIDAAMRRELEASVKDRAELTMIVDLLRNDLGRVCSYGSVRVTQPGEIEEHPTVYHRVATIEGKLAPERNWADLLRATFPGGSVTGVPKIRAMQIINELEPTARDVYCGSIGWIGLDGNMSLNIAIRTMVQTGDRVYAYAGGAIVADSKPEAEYAEILAKARGMVEALGCKAPDESQVKEEVSIA